MCSLLALNWLYFLCSLVIGFFFCKRQICIISSGINITVVYTFEDIWPPVYRHIVWALEFVHVPFDSELILGSNSESDWENWSNPGKADSLLEIWDKRWYFILGCLGRKNVKSGCYGMAIFHLTIILKEEKSSLKREKIEADVDKNFPGLLMAFHLESFAVLCFVIYSCTQI